MYEDGLWNKVGDKMQTITRIEEDTYIMNFYLEQVILLYIL